VGTLPSWWPKPLKELKAATFNARAETVAEKPFFRDASSGCAEAAPASDAAPRLSLAVRPAAPVSASTLRYLIRCPVFLLRLGGSNDVRNLWPQRFEDADKKDRLENHLHASVCGGAMPLAEAQSLLASHWVAAYHKYFRDSR